MKTILRAIAAVAAASPAFAAAGTGTEGGGILLYLFLGFAALIVVFQAVPALVLFATMMKEIFAIAWEKLGGAKEKETR